MQRLWTVKNGEPHYTFDLPNYRGTVERRVMPAPYYKRHPTIIRTAARDAAVVDAATNGWPAFIGSHSSESPLANQWRLYREALAAANHPQAVVDECLRWCTVDWISVVVADTDEKAKANAAIAQAEHLEVRTRYIERYGSVTGPVVIKKEGQSASAAYAAGGDMFDTIAGSPETVAAKVAELQAIGINHLMVRFLGEWTGSTRWVSEESMRLFARDVLPRFVHGSNGVRVAHG